MNKQAVIKCAAILAVVVVIVTAVVVGYPKLFGSSSTDQETTISNSGADYQEAPVDNSTNNSIDSSTNIQNLSATEDNNGKSLESAVDDSASTIITLNGTTAEVSGTGASVSGGTVTITSAGTYIVSGTLTKGQILINATKNDTVNLILSGADITAENNAAVYAAVADELVLLLADGTTNTLTDVSSYTYADAEKEEPNAALFSKCDLTISGTGSLTVNGNFNHGITTKDDLVIIGGNITVNSVNTAIRGKDSVTILDGVFNLTTSDGDGIETSNETDADKGWISIKGGMFNITAYNDAIQADTTLQIDDGIFNITTGGGWPGGSLQRGSHATTNEGVVAKTNPEDGSYKGLKSSGDIVINGGTFTISSYDDSVHSNGNVTINGGSLTAQSGDDGIHADGTVTVSGGTVDIQNSYEGVEGAFINLGGGKTSVYATDDGMNVSSSSGVLTISGGEIYINSGGDGIDSNGNIIMTGGTVYVNGPTTSGDGGIDYQGQFTLSGGTLISASLQDNYAPSSSEQPSITVYYTVAQTAGTEISVRSQDGTILVSHTPQKDYKSAVISASGLKQDETYAIYSGETKLCDVTLSASVTTIDSTGAAYTGRGGMGGMGGMGGRGGMGGNPGGMFGG